MNIAVEASDSVAFIIRQLLLPWNINFTDLNAADLTLVYEQEKVKKNEKGLSPKPSLARNDVSPILSLKPEKDDPKSNSSIPIDVIKNYDQILDKTLNAKISALFNLATSLPIRYNIVPPSLRKLYMKKREYPEDFNFSETLLVDDLRNIISKSIEEATNRQLIKRGWKGKKFAILLTHDTDSDEGLRSSASLLRLEQKYNISSAWYVPSKFCKKHRERIRDLASSGEVGAHDTKHDGKLDLLPEEQLVGRVQEAKKELEKETGSQILGFRAPLLQHSSKIIRALEDANYTYDTSIPTWEPFHPKTRSAHGIATSFPLFIEGLLEIPVTMVQDHQMLRVLGLNPQSTIERWAQMMGPIKKIGGMCNFLIHPDYDFSFPENLKTYEEFLNLISSEHEAQFCLPSQVHESLS